jgi:hypothetical protein
VEIAVARFCVGVHELVTVFHVEPNGSEIRVEHASIGGKEQLVGFAAKGSG